MNDLFAFRASRLPFLLPFLPFHIHRIMIVVVILLDLCDEVVILGFLSGNICSVGGIGRRGDGGDERNGDSGW